MEINHTYDQHDLQVCLKPTTGHQQQPTLSPNIIGVHFTNSKQ